MILRLSVCGLLILLIVVIALSYYKNKEGFENLTNLMDYNKVKGRYIKIEQKQQGCLNLAEIQVYSDKNGKNIIEPNMVISQSSPADPAKKLLDGNPDTIGHTSCSDVGWFLLDLGSVVPIYKIVITNRKDCCRERANGITVSILNGIHVVYKSNPFKDTKGRTSYTELGGNNATMNEYYYTFTLFPPYPNPFGDLPSTVDFETASDIDVVKGWSRTNPLEDPNPMLTNETPESCRQMALNSNGKYVAWGYRKDNHPTDYYKNTCYLYKKGFGPFRGDDNDNIHLTGCINPGEKVELGCKVSPQSTEQYNKTTPESTQSNNSCTQSNNSSTQSNNSSTQSNNSSTQSNNSSTQSDNSSTPYREDINPQVKVSEIGFDAMKLQEEVNRLNDVQKAFRNDVLANREILHRIQTEKDKLAQESVNNTASILQGKEYENGSFLNSTINDNQMKNRIENDDDDGMNGCYEGTTYRCPKNPDGSCPPLPDMTKYIRKDSIPCWGCNIDY